MTDSVRDLAREVLIHGPLSRAELGRRLGLSPASLTRLSKPFLDLGLFVEGVERVDGGVGRPSKPLDVRVDAQRFVGVKLTGTDARAVATDLRATQLSDVVVPFASTELDAVVAAVVRAVDDLGGAASFAALGISLGGKVSADGTVVRAPFLGWRDVALGPALAAATGLPVTVENDVVALTVAEHWFGLAKGMTDLAVLTVGAGVGYGLVIRDHVVAPPDAGLGLAGHYPLDPVGPLCFLGHRGCSTAMLASPSILAQVSGALGREVSFDEVLAAAAAGEPVESAVVAASGRALGRMIAAIANLAMVDVVVLSGEGVALYTAAEETVRAAIEADRDPDASPVQVLVDDSGFSPWARGAAAAAIREGVATLAL